MLKVALILFPKRLLHTGERGGVLHELALVLPLLILLATVAMDFAHFYHTEQRVAILGREIGSAVLNRCIFPKSDARACLAKIEPDLRSLAREALPEIEGRGVIHITRPSSKVVQQVQAGDLVAQLSFLSAPGPMDLSSRIALPLLRESIATVAVNYPSLLVVEILFRYSPPVPLSRLYDFTREGVIYKASIH